MITIATTFTNRPDAESALAELTAGGFKTDQLSMLMTEDARGHHFRVMESSKGAEGALGGGVVGGAIGALVAGLVAVGIIAAPGLGLVAAGPLLAALAGAGAGATSGGLIGGLIGLGIPEHEAKVINNKVVHGGILIAVQAKDPGEEHVAREILHRHTDAKISVAAA